MKKKMIALCIAATFSATLSGCSATSALGLLSAKPEVTAQVGKENTKQLVGATSKQEKKSEVKVDNSNVGKVETSSRKVEAIKAETIQAERIEVVNETSPWPYLLTLGGMFIAVLLFNLIYFTRTRKQKKDA